MTDVLSNDEARALAQSIAYGSEEAVAQSLQHVARTAVQRGAQGTQAGVSPQLIVNAAVQQAVATMAFQANLERVGAEHTDIFNDRGLTILAADEVGNIRQKYAALGQQPPPDLDVYREACNNVRQRYGGGYEAPAQASAQPAPVVGRRINDRPTMSNRPESASQEMRGDPTSTNPAEFQDVTDDPTELLLRDRRSDTVRKMIDERRVGVSRD
jgi:hypothetical protein